MTARTVVPAAATALLLTLGLAGCAGQPAADSCVPTLQPGPISDSVTVLGAFGTEPTVTLQAPAASAASQRTVIQPAEDRSEVAQDGDIVSINFGMYSGATGELLEKTPFNAPNGSVPLIMDEAATQPGLVKGLRCAAPGDRIVLSLSPEDGFGEAASAQMGLSGNEQLVLVIDVASVAAPAVSGRERSLPGGFPGVVTAENGQPGVVLPPGAAPAETTSAVRIAGSGDPVAPEDQLIAQILTVDWATGAVVRSSWADGVPAMLGADTGADPLRAELTGARVGSQIVVITVTEAGNQVSVVDVLTRAQAQAN